MIYIAVATPMIVSFIDEIKVFLVFEVMSIFIQLIVILVNFRTPIIVKGGYTLNLWLVIKNYFDNGLITDLIGLLPLNIIFAY